MNDKRYLGTKVVDISETSFNGYTKSNWVLYFIECYGCIDGAHHKDWVMDQCARIIKGTRPVVELSKWDDGTEEYSVSLGEPTEEYHSWVAEQKDGEDGPDTYGYNFGIAP